MVSVGYMIDNPGPPRGLNSFINRRVIPPAIDAAGAVESAIYELGEHVRAKPNTSMVAAAALGLAAGAFVFRRVRR